MDGELQKRMEKAVGRTLGGFSRSYLRRKRLTLAPEGAPLYFIVRLHPAARPPTAIGYQNRLAVASLSHFVYEPFYLSRGSTTGQKHHSGARLLGVLILPCGHAGQPCVRPRRPRNNRRNAAYISRASTTIPCMEPCCQDAQRPSSSTNNPCAFELPLTEGLTPSGGRNVVLRSAKRLVTRDAWVGLEASKKPINTPNPLLTEEQFSTEFFSKPSILSPIKSSSLPNEATIVLPYSDLLESTNLDDMAIAQSSSSFKTTSCLSSTPFLQGVSTEQLATRPTCSHSSKALSTVRSWLALTTPTGPDFSENRTFFEGHGMKMREQEDMVRKISVDRGVHGKQEILGVFFREKAGLSDVP
ncbi:predicted protein [Uncinocarpus reesii 1704]|uniref:Uncharacterized protein n=1 Tax=Uncinocarpus reesii (strain UAMH 1704) TaxID=336963 RepID=C4JZG9_UNCRE|nr:uncharacterized protein UREG_07570 [Uncinocarpus reesii 1704]EEP82705.1 predicted protein [Uncinocarpus reesii 1704]